MLNVKNYLNQAFYLHQLILEGKHEIGRLRELAASIRAPELSNGAVRVSQQTDKVGEIVARIADLEADILTDMSRCVGVQSAIYAAINRVDDDLLKLILQKRYLGFKRWERIAEELGIKDLRWVYRLHNRALEKVKNLFETA